MHSSRCIDPAAGLRTVALPRQGAQQAAASVNGAAASFQLQARRSHALWVSLSGTARLDFYVQTPGQGGAEQVVSCFQHPGTERYVFPQDVVDVQVTGGQSVTVDGLAWIEDMTTYRPEEDDCTAGHGGEGG